MNKKIISILLIVSMALTLQSAYKTNQYMKVVEVKGKVKISSQKAIVKPAQNGDLLFTKDNISTEKNSSLTSYLESNNIFKVKENSSLNIDESYDKTGNTKLSLNTGDFIIVVSSNAKPGSVTVLTPNADVAVNGTALISYTNGNTKAQFLYGNGKVNGTNVNQFSEVNIDNSNKLSIKNIEINASLTNTINEIAAMPYIETIVPDAAKIKNYYNYNNAPVSETNTIVEIEKDYSANTNENRTTLIITNQTK
ncbi:FecR domain-containing protein [Brachyspira alvinipulli]|uniref:FecR domain-containing protein n=1 Tax=Brachyspira alvinipulli TaxID=84379 RepID=UPI00300695D9